MKNKINNLARLIMPLFCIAAWFSGGYVSASDFSVGTAAVNISPPNGTPLAGYYHERGSQGVADDLFAKAVLLDDGHTRVAFVVCDLISLPRYLVLDARKLIETQTGIPGGNVMLSVTHSHTGPVIVRKSAIDDLTGANSELAKSYTAELPKRITQAVSDACRKMVPARVSFAHENENRLAFNRRFIMRDGSVGWNPGKLNANIVRPAGPVDPEVGVVYFESPDKKPQLTYVNFALHADTTGGMLVSADYSGALSRCLATYMGPEMLTLFANGTCGNINHINVNWGGRQQGVNEANRLGTILAAAVFKAMMDLQKVDNTTLHVRSEVVPLPLPKITDDDIREAQEVLKKDKKPKFMEQVKAYKVLDVQKQEGKPLEVEVQVITMGNDLAWVSMPGETFVEIGLSIKAASPFRQTHIATLANGSIGYIPNREAYSEGNYEPVSARCAEGSGEMLMVTAIRLLNDLKASEAKHAGQ